MHGRNPDFQVPQCQYDRFDILRKIQTMIEIPYPEDHATYGGAIRYEKMIQTGDLEHFDYNVGFLNVSVSPCRWKDDDWCVRIYFATIDDGDFGGRSVVMDRDECIKLTEQVANEVFRDLDRLPCKDELNVMLRPYRIYCSEEC